MATFVNDLRLTELATGEGSGTWGTTTNTNLSLIGESFSFGTEAITTNADTHTTTIADGSTDPGRSLFLKYTGTLDSACTITIGPNTVSKLWFIENATSGSQNIIISQGSGANITIPNGQTKAIYSDGAGSGAAMVDAFQDLSIPDLFVDDDLTVGDDLILSSDSAIIKFGADADTTLTHTDGSGLTLNSTNKIMFNDASQFIQGSSATVLSLGATDEIDLTATAIDVNGTIDVSGNATLGGTLGVTGAVTADAGISIDNITIDGTEIDLSSGDLTIDVAGDIILDANGADVLLKDDGTQFGEFTNSSSDFVIKSSVSDKDMLFKGNDGGSEITALTLDMSAAGAATFNDKITAVGTSVFTNLDISGDVDIDGTTNLDVVDIDGAVDMASTLQVDGAITSSDGATITVSDNSAALTLKSTDDDASIGPILDLTRDSASPAADDNLGAVRFRGDDSGGNSTNYAFLNCFIEDPTDGAEDGLLKIETRVNSSSKERITMNSTETVFNDDSADLDFRVESNGQANMFFIDGADDAVVIGNNASRKTLFNTTATAAFQIEGTSASTAAMSIVRNSNDDNGPQLVIGKSNGTSVGAVTVVTDDALLGRISFQGADGTQTVEGARVQAFVDGTPGADDMPGRLTFSTTADGASTPVERMRIDSSGFVGIGTSSATTALTVSTDGTEQLTINRADSSISTNNTVGTILFTGDDPSANQLGARIQVLAAANWTTNAFNSHITFSNDSSGTITERMRIDDTGALRINNTRTTSTNLHVVGGTGSGQIYDTAVFAGGQNSTSGSGARLYLSGCENDPISRGTLIQGEATDNSNAHALVFKTSAASSSPSERLRIAANGRLLHGTSTVPTGVLLGNQLVSSSATGSEIIAFRADTSVAVGDKTGAFLFGNSDTSGTEDHFVGMYGKVSSTNGSQDLHFVAGRSGYEGDTPDMTIASGGNVSIGSSSLSNLLIDLNGSNTGTNPAANSAMATELRMFNLSNTDNNLNGISFYNSNELVDSRIVGIHTSQSSRTGEIGFLTHDGTSLAESARFRAANGLSVGTTSELGSKSNTARVTGGRFITFGDVVGASSGSAATLVTFDTGLGVYLVSAGLSGANNASIYSATAIVHIDGSSNNTLTHLVNPSNMTLSLSGLVLSGTQTSGATVNISFSMIRIQ